MSIEARREYLRAIWERYSKGSKKQKTLILNEYIEVTKLNRKYAIRRLSQPLERFSERHRAGAPRRYDRKELLPFVRELWLAMEQIGAKRMKAALSIWLPFYLNADCTQDHRLALLKMSASTLERILHEIRQAMKPKGYGGTRKGTYQLLMHRIPIQTKDFNITGPGHLEGDTVHHCGGSVSGEYVHTLTHTDIHTSWTELRAVPNRGAFAILQATKDMEQSLPFPIISADYDNGGEFINAEMESYWVRREKPVHFVRSRAYRKNDQCYVEQKNFTHVRELFGYDRITGRDLTDRMNRIYKKLWCPLHNFFLPSQKLVSKTQVGSRYIKKYDKPRTPYQRLLESADLTEGARAVLELQYQELNPFDLRLRLEMELKTFFELLRMRNQIQAQEKPAA
jgi:hypothetical protein